MSETNKRAIIKGTPEIPYFIPPNQAHTPATLELSDNGYHPLFGKVRNRYEIDRTYMLLVATDRVSIFDFVLNASIPRKGEILTAITHFWLTNFFSKMDNHLVAVPEETPLGIYALIPPHERLLVANFSAYLDPYELIFRKHIGGSVYDEYLKTNTAGGIVLPAGLKKWSELDTPIFTPSTKAHEGHDENIKADDYYVAMGENGRSFVEHLTEAYVEAYKYARNHGILILDTKFEGSSMYDLVADEVLTPDSSRYVHLNEFNNAMREGREPAFMDKQVIREWGMGIKLPNGEIGLNSKTLDPKNREHVTFVHSLEVPPELIKEASENYRKILWYLTGKELEEYQEKEMKI